MSLIICRDCKGENVKICSKMFSARNGYRILIPDVLSISTSFGR